MLAQPLLDKPQGPALLRGVLFPFSRHMSPGLATWSGSQWVGGPVDASPRRRAAWSRRDLNNASRERATS